MNQQLTNMNTIENTKSKSTRSLRATLAIAFLGLSAVALLISNGLLLYTSVKSQQRAILSTQQLVAQGFSEEVSGFIEDNYKLLEATTEIVNLAKGSPDQKKTILYSVASTQPSFRQIVLLDTAGKNLAFFSRITIFSLTDQFTELLESEVISQTSQGHRYISQIYLDNTTHEPMMVLAIPVNAWGFQGTLAVEVNLEFMWDLVTQLKVGETGYVYVVDRLGNLIAYDDPSRALQGENVSHIREVKTFIENPTALVDATPKIVSYTGLHGNEVVGTYIPLRTPEWAVITELPWQEAYQNIIVQGTWSILITLGIAALAGVIGYFTAHRLSEPLTNLTETATKITEGNLELKAVVEGPFEFTRLADAFNSMTSQLRELVGSLELRVSERTTELEQHASYIQNRASQFQTLAQLARTISTIQDLDTLLTRITQQVSKQFGFYHVGLFLLDESKKFAVLSAANSEGGQRMLARKHRLGVGQTGIVGYVTSTGNPRIALDIGTDATYFDNPDMPDTRSEMALPLRVGTQIIGALDVQSTESNAFSEDDIEVLSILADIVSVAIENARLFEESQRVLADAQSAFGEITKETWRQVTENRKAIGYKYSGTTIRPIENTPSNTKVSPSPQAEVFDPNENQNTLNIPIKLRDQTIGMLNIDLPAGKAWDPDELDITQALAERVGIAIENAILLEESRRIAAKEQIVGEIAAKIGASINMRNVLQTAVEELGRAIPGSEIVIQLAGKDGAGGLN